jgi:photosystem II stability/assembly factor-like uncharacterized protein
MTKKIFYLFIFLFGTILTYSQTVKILTSGTKTSLRGLSVVTEKIIWASGSNGTVAKSNDGGETWEWLVVKGFEKKDFRDIEAFSDSTAIIMAVDEPAYILKTIDAGKTWKSVYKNETKGMFLDAMDFIDDKNGIVVGDPINGHFFIARTNDGGETWNEDLISEKPVADSGEACFASSGTNIKCINNSQYALVSGGLTAHLFLKNKKINLPILQGKESTGANSFALKNKKTIIIVGGDFNKKDSTSKNCFFTKNGGKTWNIPIFPPSGYRSCIQYISKKTWITCGLNGVDFTQDNGSSFTRISDQNLHVCAVSKHGKQVFFAGNGGKIAVFVK